MTAFLLFAKVQAKRVWGFLQGVMGDQAYERYLDATARRGGTPLSPRDFYLDAVKRRYSTVSRCC